MIKHFYQNNGWRPAMDSLKDKRIIDIGGANSFAYGYLDALIDIRQPQAIANNIFVGNIDEPEIWNKVKKVADKNGKWDYAISTHTLEDIFNPVFAAKKIEEIATAGLIIVPSKYQEFGRFAGRFRGFMHHHWIYDVIDGVLTAFAKINYIEYMADMSKNEGNELVVEWEDKIGLREMNDGMPYGNNEINGDEHMRQLYNQLLK